MLPTYCAPAQPRHRLKGRPRSTMDCRHQSLGSRMLWQRPHLHSCRSSPRMCRGTQHPAGRGETVVMVLPASGVTRGAGPYLSGTAALACWPRLSALGPTAGGDVQRTTPVFFFFRPTTRESSLKGHLTRPVRLLKPHEFSRTQTYNLAARTPLASRI